MRVRVSQVKPSYSFRRLEKIIIGLPFWHILSPLSVWNLQRCPTTVLNDRMWHCRKCCGQISHVTVKTHATLQVLRRCSLRRLQRANVVWLVVYGDMPVLYSLLDIFREMNALHCIFLSRYSIKLSKELFAEKRFRHSHLYWPSTDSKSLDMKSIGT